jgi:hypothetical protein
LSIILSTNAPGATLREPEGLNPAVDIVNAAKARLLDAGRPLVEPQACNAGASDVRRLTRFVNANETRQAGFGTGNGAQSRTRSIHHRDSRVNGDM